MDRPEDMKTLTVRELIERLQAIAADPSSGITLDTEAWVGTIGSPERVVGVYAHQLFADDKRLSCVIDATDM